MSARAALGTLPNVGHFVLGNLAATIRQSATLLVLGGCTTVHLTAPTRAPQPASSSSSGQNLESKSAEPKLPEDNREPSDATPYPEAPTTLPLQGFEPAIIRLSPEHQPLPLFVVTHGAGGQAEWHCRQYESMLGPGAGLLCLSGKRMAARDPTRGYYYPNHIELGNELLTARTTILEHYAPALRGESAVYVGYSQGATMGALAVAEHGELWPLMALVEGGFDSWSLALANRYKNGGGRRVLFVCGTEYCHRHASTAVSTLITGGLEAKSLYARGAGHRPDGPVAARVREGLQWLLGDDERYLGVIEHLRLPPN